MMKAHLVIAVASGVISGVVAGLVTKEVVRQEPKEVWAGHPEPTSAPNGGHDPSSADLERRIRRLEVLGTAAPVPGSEETEEAVAEAEGAGLPEPPENVEEHKQAVEQRFAQRVEEHFTEPEDSAWARPTERALESDFQKGVLTRAQNATLVEVSCRTTTCAATVEWAGYDKARSAWSELLHGDYSVNCGREIVIPDPPEGTPPDATYRATLLLNCEEARVKGMQGG
ncbi:MAG TPA: hypothetical protein VHO25_05245 [Polyangiaceae bacterium]|nr:hypothetical protein [Polyangiaceae bacterium]